MTYMIVYTDCRLCHYDVMHLELEELEEVMKKYVLRRTKSLIASQLPNKGRQQQKFIEKLLVKYMYMYMKAQ